MIHTRTIVAVAGACVPRDGTGREQPIHTTDATHSFRVLPRSQQQGRPSADSVLYRRHLPHICPGRALQGWPPAEGGLGGGATERVGVGSRWVEGDLRGWVV